MSYFIKQGDCLELMKEIPDGSVDMILTDLPYNLTDCAWDKSTIDLDDLWIQFKRILKPYCSAVLFASGKFTHKLIASNLDWFKYKWIWVKNAPTMFVHAKNAPMRRYEEIVVFSDGVINHASVSKRRMKYNPQGLIDCAMVKSEAGKDKPSQLRAGSRGEEWNGRLRHTDEGQGGEWWQRGKIKSNGHHNTYGDRPSHPYIKTGKNATPTQIHNPHPENFYIQEKTGYPSDVLYYDAEPSTKKFHPTQKPVPLLEYLIKTYTNEGETVLDATMGSGSTGVACMNTGRRFIGYEKEENFYEIAQRRIDEAIAKKEQSLFD